MAKKKKTEDLSLAEVETKVAELNRELFALRNQLSIERKLEKPHLIRAKRKEKARLLTMWTQKQRAKGVA